MGNLRFRKVITGWRDGECLGEHSQEEWADLLTYTVGEVCRRAREGQPFRAHGSGPVYILRYSGIWTPYGRKPLEFESPQPEEFDMRMPTRKRRKKPAGLSEINALARAAGMHYGDYVAMMERERGK